MESSRFPERVGLYSEEKMRIAIIGHKGYIGQNLVNHCEVNKDEVLGFDKKEGLAGENVKFFFSKLDAVVHLAAFPGVANCMSDLERATIDNISSAFNIFRECYQEGLPCIFISSQAAKYPDHSRYGTIKRMIEIEADRYNSRGGDIRVLRFTNVYGGMGYFQKKSTVIARIVKSIRENKPFVVYGQGLQTRDFIHVDDICKAIYYTIKHKPYRCPIDIGTGVGTSVMQLVRMFQKKSSDFLFTYDENSDMIGPNESIANPLSADVELGFKYHVKLQDWVDSLII